MFGFEGMVGFGKINFEGDESGLRECSFGDLIYGICVVIERVSRLVKRGFCIFLDLVEVGYRC